MERTGIDRGPTRSPRIEALREAGRAGDNEAVARFWTEIEREGTPIVEALGTPEEVLVTFVWRHRADTERVLVLGGPARYDAPLAENLMERIAGTDVWAKTYRARADIRARYDLSPNDPMLPTDTEDDARWATLVADPHNPRSIHWEADPRFPGWEDETISMVDLPLAPAQPWVEPRPTVAVGAAEEQWVPVTAGGEARRIWVWEPPRPAEALLVVLDGEVWLRWLPLAPTFANLVADGAVPPFAAVLVDTGGERERDYVCTDAMLAFLADDLPAFLASLGLPAERRIIAGQSLGGLMAAYTALRRPDAYGAAVAESGSFWWSPSGAVDGEWFASEVADETGAGGAHVWMIVGDLESERMVGSNRVVRDALERRDLLAFYREYHGGHDWLAWRGFLADALVDLWGPQRPGR